MLQGLGVVLEVDAVLLQEAIGLSEGSEPQQASDLCLREGTSAVALQGQALERGARQILATSPPGPLPRPPEGSA